MPATETLVSSAGTALPEGASADAAQNATSAAKVLRLLNAFTSCAALAGVGELAERAGLPKSTAHRLLSTLTRENYVRRAGDRYCLANHVFEVGNQVLACRPNGLREQAMPFLAELYLQTRQTVHLAVLQDSEVLYLEKIFGHNSVRVGTAVGGRRPAHATALGKAILAFSDDDVLQKALGGRLNQCTPQTRVHPRAVERQLAEIRDAGFATDREECLPGLSCIAAPIRDPLTGRAVAAVSVCTRSGAQVARLFGNSVLETAALLSRPAGAGKYARR
jgi:DNA-binding IclR family transcriptional regulator